MARTTEALVQSLLETAGDYNLRTRPSLSVFVSSATSLVDRMVACAARKSITFTDEELEIIERWLGAHFYAMVDQTYAGKGTQSASATFHGQTGLNLDGTKYGQTAKSLDTSGCLQALTSPEGKRAGATWLGKPERTQLTDRERNQ